MEEGNGMKQDGIILYFDVPKLVGLISPHLLQPTSITSHSCNIHHGPYIVEFSIKFQINYECQSFNENQFSEDNQMDVFELFQIK